MPRRNTGPGSPDASGYFKALHGFSGSQGFSHRDPHDDPREEEAQYPAGSIPETAAGPQHHGNPVPGGGRTDAAQSTLF